MIRTLWVSTALGLAGIALGVTAVPGRAQLTLNWYTVDGGGGTSSAGGDLSLGGTIGQPDAGRGTGGALELAGGFWLGGRAVSSIPDSPGSPDEPPTFRVLAGYPNPFSEATHVSLELPETTPVRVRVFEPGGRMVNGLCDELMPPGRHLFSWRGNDAGGRRVASGVYLLQVQAGSREMKRSVIYLR